MKGNFLSTAALMLTRTVSAEFAPLIVPTESGSAKSVLVELACPALLSTKTIPNTMFTIYPSDSVEVSSDPPNLVIVNGGQDVLKFVWNEDVSQTVTKAGIKIGIPAGQLKSVTVMGDIPAQVLDGFTALNEVTIFGDSRFTATTSSSEASSVDISIVGDAFFSMLSNVNITNINITGDSTVNVETPEVENVMVIGDAGLNVNGNVGSVEAIGDFYLTITGDITEAVKIIGDGEFNGASCENFSTIGDAACSTGSQSVSVDVSQVDEVSEAHKWNDCSGGHIDALSKIVGVTIIAAAFALI